MGSPEDLAAWKIDADELKMKQEKEKDEFTTWDRWRNIYLNDSENIPYALFVFWGMVLVGGNICANGAFYLSIIYCLFRLLHTTMYAMAISRARSIMWLIGQLSVLTALIMLMIGSIVEYA